MLFKTLEEHSLFAKYRNCKFLLMSVTFLCHISSSEAVEVDPRKMKAVKNWRRPLNPADIRSLLCLVGYCRRFLDVFAFIGSPLTTLSKKNKKFEWSESCE